MVFKLASDIRILINTFDFYFDLAYAFANTRHIFFSDMIVRLSEEETENRQMKATDSHA